MKIKSQICMVLNLDKCIGCQTCTVTCKNVWTTRPGVEYAWFNNVETKPGTGYPTEWENQERYKGGWRLDHSRLALRQGGRIGALAGIFANINLPSMKDYYEPFTFDFSTLKKGPFRTPPSARPHSIITGKLMEKIEKGPNWEDDLSGTFATRSSDPDLQGIDTTDMEAFERTFMMWLPRLCEHCLNPACVAACPSGAIYKRDEDGVVLIDETRCRGWRECVSACPFKKIYFNWQRKRSEKCIFCYPKIEDGDPTVCAHSCVGRIRYIGVMLYDEDRIRECASATEPTDLYESQRSLFLDPRKPEVEQAALDAGISWDVVQAAKISPILKMITDWEIALPLHPEFRTLPMQWYIPPLSPQRADAPVEPSDSALTSLDAMRIPVKYLANIFTAGDEAPVRRALTRLLAMRNYMRSQTVEGDTAPASVGECGLTPEQLEEMYRYLAIADYGNRFVVPTRRIDHERSPFASRSESGYPRPRGKQKPYNLFGGM